MEYINEVKRFQQLAGILNESLSYSLNESEQAADKAVDDLKQKAEKAGVDTDNEKVQMDILNKMIDADFDLAKINVNQIKEYDENLEESGGALATSVHAGVEILENAELIEKIAHLLHVDIQKVKNALKWVVKITSYPSRLIDKLFFKVARLLGANVENARVAGMGGIALVALVCFIFGIIYFPSLLPSVVGFWGLAKFIWAIIKSISGIHTMWKQLTGAQQEQKAYTTADFFKEIEKKYMETEGSEGKKIPTDWVYELSDWYDSLSKSDKPQASTTMKSLAQSINSGKGLRGHVQKLNDMGNTDSKVIFNTIATYIELMQKGVTVSDKFKQSSDKLEEIAKEILLKYNNK